MSVTQISTRTVLAHQANPEEVRISELPDEILQHIFSFLPAMNDVVCASLVCRNWHTLASEDILWDNLKARLFPNVNVIDGEAWKRFVNLSGHGLEIDDLPPLKSRNIVSVLQRMYGAVEGDAGVTILTLPKGLTFNELVKISGSPKAGNSANFRHISPEVSEGLGSIPIKATTRVAITNSIINGSRNKNIGDQIKIAQAIRCEMPGVLPTATLAILTYIMSTRETPTRLLSDNPWTYIRCQERLKDFYVIVGGFATAGLYALNIHYDSDSSLGSGALRKFQGH